MTEKPSKSTHDEALPKSNGMTVPDGYFADFKTRMMARLPEMPAVAEATERTRWQKLKPYVYMAAMFAGAYLMLNLFTISEKFRPASSLTASADPAPSELLAEVVNTGTLAYVDDYISIDEYDLYDDLYESGYEIPE